MIEKIINDLGVGISIETTLQNTVKQLVEMRIKQEPELKPFEKVMMEFFGKYLSYESLKDDMSKLYADTFTTEELNAIAAFYGSEAGKKMLQNTPEILKESAQIGMLKANENMDEFKKMVEEESKRIQTREMPNQ